jgi:tetratricopeptide (TPR) repeat protein
MTTTHGLTIDKGQRLLSHPPPADAQELNRRGIARFQDGDVAGALHDFRRAAATQSGYAEAWNNAGLARQMLGELPEAVADFDRALAIRADYPEALNNRGRAHQLLGDATGARVDFERAVACASGSFAATVYYNRGRLRQQQGELAKALADFDHALEIDPGHGAALVARGQARKEAGDLEGALADFDRALGQGPPQGLAAAYHGRGGVRALQNDFKGAVADYDCALALAPRQFHLYISRGNARYHRRDPGALRDYRTAFGLEAEGAARDLVRTLATDARRDAEAVLQNCEKHQRLNDRDVIASARRGLTLVLLGREGEAAPDLARLQRMLPDMQPHLQRLLELARGHRGEIATAQAAGKPSGPGERLTDTVFAGYWAGLL